MLVQRFHNFSSWVGLVSLVFSLYMKESSTNFNVSYLLQESVAGNEGWIHTSPVQLWDRCQSNWASLPETSSYLTGINRWLLIFSFFMRDHLQISTCPIYCKSMLQKAKVGSTKHYHASCETDANPTQHPYIHETSIAHQLTTYMEKQIAYAWHMHVHQICVLLISLTTGHPFQHLNYNKTVTLLQSDVIESQDIDFTPCWPHSRSLVV